MKANRTFILSLIILLLLSSCKHKELCLHHVHSIPAKVNVDWSMFEVEQVQGMTVYAYSQQHSQTEKVTTNNVEYAMFDLFPDTYNFLVHNYSQSELYTLELLDMDDYDNARVFAATTTSRWYMVKSEEEVIAQEPQWFGFDLSEPVEVTQQMVDEHYERFYLKGSGNESDENAPVLTTLTPSNIVYNITVTVNNIGQIYNLSDVRASISRMARGYYLTKGYRSSDIATYILEDWEITRSDYDPSIGSATTLFRCFGLPYGHDAEPSDNILLLQVLLVDLETIVEIPVQVGHLFRVPQNIAPNELHLELNVDLNYDLPDVPPAEGGDGGFSATVDDWGDEIEHEIDLQNQ